MTPTRAASRPVQIRAAVGVVAVAAVLAIAFAVASSWAGRVGVGLAVGGGVAGVWLMLRALRTQTEAATAELREQARRAQEALTAQHQREREALKAIEIRTNGLQDTITALRSHLEEAEDVNDDLVERLEASEAEVGRLEEQVTTLSERIDDLGAVLGSRTTDLAVARDRIAELEGMVALYEDEILAGAGAGAEVFGLPRRRTA